MNKCSYYRTQKKRKYLCVCFENFIDWKDAMVGICSGTKECEPCSCNGDKLKCDFYDYVREKARKEQLDYKINQAITFLKDNGYEVKKI